MTNAAIARRPDFHPLNKVPQGLEGIAQTAEAPPALAPAPAAGGAAASPPPSPPSNNATNALQVIATFIPIEVLTLYVAAVAALHKESEVTKAEWIAFWVFLILTPTIVWVVYAAKVKSAGKPLPAKPTRWPLWEMSAATIAYVVWAYALPGSPFSQFEKSGFYSSALAGLFVLGVSTILGLVAPLFQRPLKT